MYQETSQPGAARPPIGGAESKHSEDTPVIAAGPPPIVLETFGRRAEGPRYGWSSAFSVLLHGALIGLTLWLGHSLVSVPMEPVTVVFRRPLAPKPPPAKSPTESSPKGGRGVRLPKAVARDIQPDMELTFAAPADEELTSPTGRWFGGGGTGDAQGPGWSDGVEGGALRRHSLARDPQEVNSGWDCGFPHGGPKHDVVVRIRVHVSAEGKPTHVGILRPGPTSFNQSARECAFRQRFRPALDADGNPCEGDRDLGILFFYPGETDTPPPPPPPPPVVPPLEGPQPDLPVQLDEPSRPR